MVTGTAPQYLPPVAFPSLEPVPSQMAIRFPMPDHGLHRLPASPRIQSGLPRWSVIRIPRPRHPAQEEVAPVGGGHAPLDTEFVPLVGLALANTLDFRGLPAGPRVPALRLRRQYPPGHRPFVRNPPLPIWPPRGVSFPVPNHPAQVGPQTLDRTVHTAPLPGLGNPVRPPPRPRLPGAARKTGIDRRWQDPLGPGRPDARATPRPAARVDRRMMRAIFLAAKGLPVRILHPTGDPRLVREWVHLLQRLPPDHPTRGLAGTTAVGAVPHTEGLVESGPVQDSGQANPRVARIQPVFQAISEPIVGFGTRTGSGAQVVIGNGKEGSVHESRSGHWNPYFQGIYSRIFRS